MNVDPWHSLTEAADYVGTTQRHIRTLVAQRLVPSYKIGRRLRFRSSDLDNYISGCLRDKR